MEGWRRWAQGQLHRAVRLRPVDNPDGEAEVWQVCAHDRIVAYLKRHRVLDKWRRERTLLSQLADPPGLVPALLAADPAGPVLLLGVLPGRRASDGTIAPDDRRALHEQAGRFRRRLDAVPVDPPDPLPVPVAMARRHRAWCDRARPHLPPALLGRVARAFDPSCFTGATRRWCHRDLAPHNWIVGSSPAGPRLGILDFGQARPDVWLVDVLKLWDGDWVDDPTLADAFFTGYGRRPDPREQGQRAQLALLHGLATATWGCRHHDLARARHGQAVLARALAEVER